MECSMTNTPLTPAERAALRERGLTNEEIDELSQVAGRDFIRYTPEEVRKFLAGEAPLGSDRDHNTTPARKPKSDDFLYTGPVAEMPNLGPDDLDEHGAPVGEETS